MRLNNPARALRLGFCRVRIELENFSWRRASARCATAVFGTKTPPARAAPRKVLSSSSRSVFSHFLAPSVTKPANFQLRAYRAVGAQSGSTIPCGRGFVTYRPGELKHGWTGFTGWERIKLPVISCQLPVKTIRISSLATGNEQLALIPRSTSSRRRFPPCAAFAPPTLILP